MIYDIFSIGICVFNLENSLNNKDMVKYARKTSKVNQNKEDKDILSNNIFGHLNHIVKEKMEEYCKSTFNKDHKIDLFQAWSNLGDDKYITIPHTHNDAIVSAVYYPYAVDGEIIFLNPGGTSTLSQNKAWMIGEYNKYTYEYFSVEARTGTLVVFNSMLQHMVRCKDPNRVSIAYNGYPIRT